MCERKRARACACVSYREKEREREEYGKREEETGYVPVINGTVLHISQTARGIVRDADYRINGSLENLYSLTLRKIQYYSCM